MLKMESDKQELIRLKHKGVDIQKMFSCDICSKQFLNIADLRLHMRENHRRGNDSK